MPEHLPLPLDWARRTDAQPFLNRGPIQTRACVLLAPKRLSRDERRGSKLTCDNLVLPAFSKPISSATPMPTPEIHRQAAFQHGSLEFIAGQSQGFIEKRTKRRLFTEVQNATSRR
jgi:hypothetical protein